jgi:hypothetical protein
VQANRKKDVGPGRALIQRLLHAQVTGVVGRVPLAAIYKLSSGFKVLSKGSAMSTGPLTCDSGEPTR